MNGAAKLVFHLLVTLRQTLYLIVYGVPTRCASRERHHCQNRQKKDADAFSH